MGKMAKAETTVSKPVAEVVEVVERPELTGSIQIETADRIAINIRQSTDIVTKYPANPAISGTKESVFLMPGEIVDRFGSLKGSWLSTPSTSFGARSIPPDAAPYSQFTILKPFEVEKSLASLGFFCGQTGFGVQYQTPLPVNILIKKNIIGIIK